MNLKKGIFVVLVLLVLNIALCSAIDLSINSKPIIQTIINDYDQPAVFEVEITNNNEPSDFEIYIFERFEITPNEFNLGKDETKTFNLELLPTGLMKNNEGHIKVPVFIKERSKSETQEFELTLKLVGFENVFSIEAKNINLDSEFVEINFYNVEDISYEEVEVIFSSGFFNDEKEVFSFTPYEKKTLEIKINQNKLKKLVYGDYIIKAEINFKGESSEIQGNLKIAEKSEISVIKGKEGLIVRKTTTEKLNKGNIPIVADISLRKNIISRLFSTFSPEPNRIERSGFFVDYFWQKELAPDEKLTINATTNWIYPFLLIIAIAIIAWLFNSYFSTQLIIKKRVTFVKTKTDDFALRVRIYIKARKFVKNIKIYDRLPAMTNLYEKYGEGPAQFDKVHGKLKWEIENLAEGEKKVISYVIYSKLKVVGKFELPVARAVYEYEDESKETKSNRVYFVNEPEDKKRVEG